MQKNKKDESNFDAKQNLKSKEQPLKVTMLIFGVLLVVLSVAFSVFLVKHNTTKNNLAQKNSQFQSLSDAMNQMQEENASVLGENENKISELQSKNDADKSEYDKAKAEYEKKISELQKQKALNSTKPSAKPSNGKNKTVYLTFDDGPSERTPEILKILKDNNVKATFFVINGKNCNHYMKDIVAQGHTIALHSYTHNYQQIYASDEAFYKDLKQISDLVYEQTGVRSMLMRFPGGGSNTVSRKYNKGIMTRLTKKVGEMGYTYFDWNVSSGDAAGGKVSAQSILNNCKRLPSNNTVIVLMHDSAQKHSTVEALPQVIAYYKSIGCTFGTLSSAVPPVHQRVAN